jgi:hypothetical protein
MFKRFKRHLSPSTAIAIVALVFAMTGGAYAAKKYVITSAKQIKPSVVAQLKGKAGEKGANGPVGTAGVAGVGGVQGPAGVAGAPGEKGKDGEKGEKGEAGKDGKVGREGKEGSPWTAGGTLPVGATETGTWGFQGTPENTYRCVAVGGTGNWEEKECHSQAAVQGAGNFEREKIFQGRAPTFIPISFAIPLGAPIEAKNVQVFEGETAPTGCKLISGLLEADSGHLCIRVIGTGIASVTAAELTPFNLEELEPGSGRTGADMYVESTEGLAGAGTWAVTG